MPSLNFIPRFEGGTGGFAQYHLLFRFDLVGPGLPTFRCLGSILGGSGTRPTSAREAEPIGLRRFLNFVVADAARAGANPLIRSLDHRMDGLQIDVPAAVGHVVGVADFMPEPWSPAANFTNSCHFVETPKTPMLTHACFISTITGLLATGHFQTVANW